MRRDPDGCVTLTVVVGSGGAEGAARKRERDTSLRPLRSWYTKSLPLVDTRAFFTRAPGLISERTSPEPTCGAAFGCIDAYKMSRKCHETEVAVVRVAEKDLVSGGNGRARKKEGESTPRGAFVEAPFLHVEGVGYFSCISHIIYEPSPFAPANFRHRPFSLVPGKPFPVRNCTLANQTYTSVEVRCVPGYDGGLPQKFVLEVYHGDVDYLTSSQPLYNVSNPDEPSFALAGLEASVEAGVHVAVYAVNAKGRSQPVILSEVTYRDAEKRTGKYELTLNRRRILNEIGDRYLVDCVPSAVITRRRIGNHERWSRDSSEGSTRY